MEASALLKTLLAQRVSSVEVAQGKQIKVRRPTEVEIKRDFLKVEDARVTINADYDEVKTYTVGWEGVTEADILGAAGASSPAEFSAELWAQVVADKYDWVQKVANRLIELIVEHQTSKAEAAKN